MPAPRFRVILAIWTAVGVFTIAQESALRATAHQSLPVAAITGTLFSVWLWAAYTPLIWWLAIRWPVERAARAALLVHLAAAGGLTVLEAALGALVLPHGLGFVRRLLAMAVVNLFSYAGVVALATVRRFQLRSAAQEARAAALEADLQKARLSALEAQLRPHFLFNSLNTISSLVRAREDQAAIRAVAALGDVLRGALRQTAPEVALGVELGLAERYLDLERARFGESLVFSVEADEAARSAQVPSLLLQPLVENALEHGRSKDGAAHVQIHAARNGDQLRIEVRDRGCGPAGGAPEHIGLSNTRARLEQLYGSRGRLRLLSREGGGAVAVVELPLRGAA